MSLVSQVSADCSEIPKVPETTTLEEAQAIMAKHQLQSVPLVDKAGKLVCLLTAAHVVTCPTTSDVLAYNILCIQQSREPILMNILSIIKQSI